MSTASDRVATGPGAMIPLCEPTLGGNEWKYVKECLDTNWVSSAGKFVDRFEEMVAAYMGARYAVATASGTAALHVALLVAGVQPEDEVLVSALTFVAPVNAIRYVGAWPVFMDAAADCWQMDPEKVIDFLDKECEWRNGDLRNKSTGRRIKAVLPVHILGHPVDLDPILDAVRGQGISVVEDATETMGGKYKGRVVGALGDISCLSFNGNKLITSGGGGMIVTDDPHMAERAKYLTTQARDDTVEYVHNEIGYNYRLSNLHAAVGCAQMERLESHIAAKLKVADHYNQRFRELDGIQVPTEMDWAESVFWLYTVLVDQDRYPLSSRQLLQNLDAKGIQTRPLWKPVCHLPPYADCQAYKIEVAPKLYQQGLSLPCSVGITQGDLDQVAEAIETSARTSPSADTGL